MAVTVFLWRLLGILALRGTAEEIETELKKNHNDDAEEQNGNEWKSFSSLSRPLSHMFCTVIQKPWRQFIGSAYHFQNRSRDFPTVQIKSTHMLNKAEQRTRVSLTLQRVQRTLCSAVLVLFFVPVGARPAEACRWPVAPDLLVTCARIDRGLPNTEARFGINTRCDVRYSSAKCWSEACIAASFPLIPKFGIKDIHTTIQNAVNTVGLAWHWRSTS